MLVVESCDRDPVPLIDTGREEFGSLVREVRLSDDDFDFMSRREELAQFGQQLPCRLRIRPITAIKKTKMQRRGRYQLSVVA